jgi:hypothetical protein
MIGKIILRKAVGEHEDRSVFVDLPNFANGEASPWPVVADQGVFIIIRRVELGDSLFVEATLQDLEPGRTRTSLFVPRNPCQFLELVGSDAAPKARALGSITDDDSTSQTALVPSLDSQPNPTAIPAFRRRVLQAAANGVELRK